MDPLVRPRTAADLPACVEALRRTHAVDRYPMVWPAAPVAWLMPPTQLAAWVATADDDVVGHVLLAGLAGGRAAISRLLVVPRAQGRGVAGALIAAAESRAGQLLRRLELDVVEESAAAIRLYERLGWTLVERGPADFTWPDGTRPVQRRYEAPGRTIDTS
ncbi:N-acetyltransferase family protein [Actinomycetospora sp. CA-084318]|uniref:GNAT family N-acetyltransferase n=1 Tax=Actinomycetospora sp. CA-084318 TaxID=3239892 RepID=UPI003D978408